MTEHAPATFTPAQLAELEKLQRRMTPTAALAVLRDRIRRREATTILTTAASERPAHEPH